MTKTFCLRPHSAGQYNYHSVQFLSCVRVCSWGECTGVPVTPFTERSLDMPNVLTPVGPDIQINIVSDIVIGNNHILGGQSAPHIALLPDGRFVVTYHSAFNGDEFNTDPVVAIFNPTGSTSLASLEAYLAGGVQVIPEVAARLDGGYGVVFMNQRHADGSIDNTFTNNITYRPVSATGVLGTPIAIGDLDAWGLFSPAIATLS